MFSNKGKYCCFDCPESDFSEKSLDDTCPSCGRKYCFPLEEFPERIDTYKIIESKGRGFYGATFVARQDGKLPKNYVLKIIPKKIYAYFKKDFSEECVAHANASENADYIVGIADYFESVVNFKSVAIDCHIAVLDYIDGNLLSDFLSGKEPLTAAVAAQIAADLFRIHDEFSRRRINHNDFHSGNIMIEKLTQTNYRHNAMAPAIRAIAIDLGSVADDRRSGNGYKSDLHWISSHIDILSKILSQNPSGVTDLDVRLALELQILSSTLSPAVESQRMPAAEELIRNLEDAFYRTAEPWQPWRKPFALRKFDDSYNAQTLEAWNVPQLLVDIDGSWQQNISAGGPLIVTGMRGCGKTMLLKALQFHARAARKQEETDQQIIERLKNDGYVGFFVSASALLNLSNEGGLNTPNMFARLAIAYALEASRALAHLKDISANLINERAPRYIGEALNSILKGGELVALSCTVQEFERLLVNMLIISCRSDSEIEIAQHPSNAFPVLADAIQKCATIWSDEQVLFLLDDVSTRYLEPTKIEEILSALIFQSPKCSFKITSETQTIFLSLKSPGSIEPAAHWRDFKTFDLGEKVHKKLKQKGGKQFLSDVLANRARFSSSHPAAKPEVILGDRPLVEIADTICHSAPNSKARKEVYHGFSALKAVCVGDIGSAISIYQNILSHSNGKFPVPAQEQSDVFQEFCSVHLYHLDRRGSHFKSVAKSFASASYQLLMQSGKKNEARGLRQYSSIYVRVTAGDKEEQGRQLRELVDAGVFVFQGGVPRTKTKDSDPVQQFKLVFRKIYGLADFIGLSERDRFELSGDELAEWLNKPEQGADILMRNLRTDTALEEDLEDDDDTIKIEPAKAVKLKTKDIKREHTKATQKDLFEAPEATPTTELTLPVPDIREITAELAKRDVDTLYVALGFEQRTFSSLERTLSVISPKKIVAIKYLEEGRTNEMVRLIESKNIQFEILDYSRACSELEFNSNEMVAVDITGMTKALIFSLTVNVLRKNRKFLAVYTEAEQYYPLEENLKAILDAQSQKDYDSLLTKLKEVLSGERGPYFLEAMNSLISDETRMRALFAFSSAKHERLIYLTEKRKYDMIKVVADSSKSARATVARLAAEVAARGAEAGLVEECDINSPMNVLSALEGMYRRSYHEGGFNFEIGLTGDKLEALAASAFCARYSVNNVWYVKPSAFESDRFTKGTKVTHYFELTY